jgi:hypothetical protein
MSIAPIVTKEYTDPSSGRSINPRRSQNESHDRY